jgi:hypothetical protein
VVSQLTGGVAVEILLFLALGPDYFLAQAEDADSAQTRAPAEGVQSGFAIRVDVRGHVRSRFIVRFDILLLAANRCL